MYFLVIAHFDPPSEVAKRYLSKDIMLPLGLEAECTWIDVELKTSFLVLKTLDLRLLHRWMALWSDIVKFEVIRVYNGEQARNAMMRLKITDGKTPADLARALEKSTDLAEDQIVPRDQK